MEHPCYKNQTLRRNYYIAAGSRIQNKITLRAFVSTCWLFDKL